MCESEKITDEEAHKSVLPALWRACAKRTQRLLTSTLKGKSIQIQVDLQFPHKNSERHHCFKIQLNTQL